MRAVGTLSIAAALCLGCTNNKTQRIQEAEKVAAEEQTAEKLFVRGQVFARIGDHTRASQYFEAAIDAGAEPREVLPHLMRTYIVSQRYRLAIDVGERYLNKNPTDHHLRFLVATLYTAIEQHQRARAYLERVLAEDPKHAEAHYLLAVLLRDQSRDWVGADHHFRRYLMLNPAGPHAAEARASLLESVP